MFLFEKGSHHLYQVYGSLRIAYGTSTSPGTTSTILHIGILMTGTYKYVESLPHLEVWFHIFSLNILAIS